MSRPGVLIATAAAAQTYRRRWRSSVFTTVVTPVLMLVALGLGLGSLVDHGVAATRSSLEGVKYLRFLAPGLLAVAAVQTAANEGLFPVIEGIKWRRTYYAMVATPLNAADVALGQVVWIVARVALTCVVFAAATLAFGGVGPGGAASAGFWLALAAAVLTGASFAGPVVAYAATFDTPVGMNSLMRFGIIPMTLFGGTFFPVSQLPVLVRPLAYATPLWHGVDLCRQLALGRATAGGVAFHVAYLLAWAVLGAAAAVVRLRRRLVV